MTIRHFLATCGFFLRFFVIIPAVFAQDDATVPAEMAKEPPSSIRVESAYTFPTIGTQKVVAGYVDIQNTSTQDDRLIKVHTPISERAEIHTHMHQGGIMRMRRLEALDIPAGQNTTFQPGGLHIMIMNLNKPLNDGERFPITLTFEQAGVVNTQMEVRKRF